jgi:hypothetical protein
LSEVKVKAKDVPTLETARLAVAPYAKTIEDEARGGWALHSLTLIKARVVRRKGILEILLGWIPVIGGLFKPKKNNADYYEPEYYIAVFVKET